MGGLAAPSEPKRSKDTKPITYVLEHRDGVSVNHEITDAGMAELAKYGMKYVKELDWPYPGTNDTFSDYSKHRGKWHCAVCDSLKTDATIEMGYAPRYATCKKHHQFLLLTPHLVSVNDLVPSDSESI